MTVEIPQVANSSTFYFWKTQSNLLANAMSTSAVTVNSNTAYGNAAISGTFTSNKVNTFNLSVSGTAVVNAISVSGGIGQNGQVLTSNGNGSYWSTVVGTVSQINTSGGITGGPITTTGTIALNLYVGAVADNVNYPVGTVVSVYAGIGLAGQRQVASTQVIYSGNLNGIEGVSGAPLNGVWRNRGLCGTDYRSPTEIRYYYLYQRVA